MPDLTRKPKHLDYYMLSAEDEVLLVADRALAPLPVMLRSTRPFRLQETSPSHVIIADIGICH